MEESTLTTASAVIDALGGPTKVARLTKRAPQQFVNARKTGRLPYQTFLTITQALAERSKSAPPRLWGIEEPEAPLAPQD